MLGFADVEDGEVPRVAGHAHQFEADEPGQNRHEEESWIFGWAPFL